MVKTRDGRGTDGQTARLARRPSTYGREGGETMEKKEFIPIDYNNIHYHLLENKRQWCISPSCKKRKEGK
jgi:hypothetical protein